MRTHHYPSDLTDEQWPLIEAHLPAAPPGGRPRSTDLRDVIDAIFYILRTGCQWRYLPNDFPPKSTVWRYFDRWRRDGTLDRIHDALRRKVRTAEKPYDPRTTASVESQSVDTTSGGEARGRDNAKNVDGRKRHIIIDTMGLLLAVVVTGANADDGTTAPRVLDWLGREAYPRLEVVRGGREVPERRAGGLPGAQRAGLPLRGGPAAGGCEGVRAGAEAVGGGADARLDQPVPAARQGREVVAGVERGDGQGEHDSFDAQAIEA